MDGPGKKRKPQACQYFGRLTFLTVQSNILLTLYHALRHVRPESYIAVHAYPYAFAAGVGLTINYYGLDHFLPEKIAEDKRWIEKGYTMIPVANHLEHGLALPTALYWTPFLEATRASARCATSSCSWAATRRSTTSSSSSTSV